MPSAAFKRARAGEHRYIRAARVDNLYDWHYLFEYSILILSARRSTHTSQRIAMHLSAQSTLHPRCVHIHHERLSNHAGRAADVGRVTERVSSCNARPTGEPERGGARADLRETT